MGASISIPCEKREYFTINYDVKAISGSITHIEPEMDNFHYDGAFQMKKSLMGESLYIESTEEYFRDFNQVVLKIDVNTKINSVDVIVHAGNTLMFSKLEEYGVAFQFGKSEYEISEEMKNKLNEELHQETEKDQTKVIDLSKHLKEDILKQLINGKNNFVEVDGNKKIEFSVQRKMFKQDANGTIQEIDMN